MRLARACLSEDKNSGVYSLENVLDNVSTGMDVDVFVGGFFCEDVVEVEGMVVENGVCGLDLIDILVDVPHVLGVVIGVIVRGGSHSEYYLNVFHCNYRANSLCSIPYNKESHRESPLNSLQRGLNTDYWRRFRGFSASAL